MIRKKLEKLIHECLKLTHGEADSKSGAIVVIYYPVPVNPEVEKKEEYITDKRSMSLIKKLQAKIEVANYVAEMFKKEANNSQTELNKAVTQITELSNHVTQIIRENHDLTIQLIKCKQNQSKPITNQE